MTAQSARLPNARIIAVEMLRGPDHMAMRTGGSSVGVTYPASPRFLGLQRLVERAQRACVIGPEASAGSRGAVADRAPVDLDDRRQAGEGAGAERFVGAVDVEQREVLLEGGNARPPRGAQHRVAGDAGQAIAAAPRSTARPCGR